MWGNISYIMLSSQIFPVVGIYLPHLTGLQFLFILGWICGLKSLKQGRADILPSTGQENMAQPKTDKWHSSPSHFFVVFHRLTVV